MSNVNITVLKDESLGGVEREYNEVKRKASAGERIIIVDPSTVGYAKGDIRTVEDDDYDWSGSGSGDRDGTGVSVDGGIALFHRRYAVLEPSDIIRIGSDRFRMVDRKATVGERVIVTELVPYKGSCNGEFFRIGNIARCIGEIDFDFAGNDYVCDDGKWAMGHECYHVLEPLGNGTSTTTLLSSVPAAEQSAEIIATLTSEVEALKKRVTTLESVGEAVRLARLIEELGNVLRSALETANPSKLSVSEDELQSAIDTDKTPQQIRDEIVERAKADVVRLINEDGFAYRHRSAFKTVVIEEFVINREKRTVVVLGYEAFGNRKKRALGIAKCSANDVFNAHIGKAISLRRALGLEVPAEYLSVPSPTEVRVGDEIKWEGAGLEYRVEGISGNTYDLYSYQLGHVIEAYQLGHAIEELEYPGLLKYCRIIDDSREDNVTTRGEVAA